MKKFEHQTMAWFLFVHSFFAFLRPAATAGWLCIQTCRRALALLELPKCTRNEPSYGLTTFSGCIHNDDLSGFCRCLKKADQARVELEHPLNFDFRPATRSWI